MLGDVGKLFTKLLHLEEPWRVSSVNVNDEQTRVDIRVVYDGTVAVSVLLGNESLSILSWVFLALIIGGIIGLHATYRKKEN